MPNWTRNIIQIGQNVPQERFEAVMLKMLRRDSRKKSNAFVSAANARRACESNHVNFDFNALIPMPKDLDIESSSDSDKGVILYKAVLEFPEMMESRILDAITFQDVFTEGDWRACRQEYDAIAALISPRKEISPTAEQALEKLKELVKGTLKMQKDSYWGYPFLPEMNYFKGQEGYDVAQFPKRIRKSLNSGWGELLSPMALMQYIETEDGSRLIRLGQKSYENLQKYGAMNWYDWCCEHWGTKWNASETSVDWEKREIRFSTAWSEPVPIMSALHEDFPDVDFTWSYADEDRGHGTGVATAKDGSYTVDNLEDGSPEALAHYVACWGADNCMYQDDTGAWHRYDCDTCPHPC